MTARYKLILTALSALLMLTGCSSALPSDNAETQEPVSISVSGQDITAPPVLILTQSQADEADPLEIRSGSYSWDYQNDDGTMTGGIACGAHPLDDETLAHTAVLTLDQADASNSISYSFSSQIMPDKITIYKWSLSDLGNTSAQEISSTVLEKDLPSVLELEAGCVYEFTAVWEEERLNENGFYGSASYVLATE